MSEQGMTEDMPVTIGDDVWIGARAILLPGITINSGSIVGAGAVVTKDVPPGSIVAGNPARVVRYRIAADPKDVEWQSR
jgi:maltose O-acetyltransferase